MPAATAGGPFFARPVLTGALVERARQGAPLVLVGPPGAGKTTLLHEAARALAAEGWVTVSLDLMGAASSPERFVNAALSVLPAAAFGGRLPQAAAIRRLAGEGKTSGAAAVQALFALWSALDEAGGRPVALLLDEVTEIRSLAYFAGLREVDKPFAAALGRRGHGTLLATSYATLARRLWPAWETLEVPTLTAAELAGPLRHSRLDADPETLARACFGWPRYVRALWHRLASGEDLATAWAAEMAPGGRLDECARHTYEALLLRSRGYGMSKAVLAAVAEEEGLNLTALVGRLGRTPGAVRDYLGWLLGVDALRMERKRYYYVDGLLAWWVRLHARGALPTDGELEAAARQATSAPGPAAAPEAAAAAEELPGAARPAARSDSLIEID